MFGPPGVGYDSAITVFSPDGRLFQVEYAMEAIRRGAIVVGVKVKNDVIMIAENRLEQLMEPEDNTKILPIDTHIMASIAGLQSDARRLIDYARVQAQVNRLTYDEPISVENLTRRLCDLMQQYTQQAGVRPFGVALMLAGIDDLGPELFTTFPSGSYWNWKASAIGRGTDATREYFEKNYNPDLSREDGIVLGLKALAAGIRETLPPDKIEIAYISAVEKKYMKLGRAEIKIYVDKSKK
ncbi:MAG: archaeal proteasome endopeptidase complex subunit alpha [Candidatus Atabeyarchaeum deiterrae]|jgi:proteasome alpha subunit